jgi:hypothetical protein
VTPIELTFHSAKFNLQANKSIRTDLGASLGNTHTEIPWIPFQRVLFFFYIASLVLRSLKDQSERAQLGGVWVTENCSCFSRFLDSAHVWERVKRFEVKKVKG